MIFVRDGLPQIGESFAQITFQRYTSHQKNSVSGLLFLLALACAIPWTQPAPTNADQALMQAAIQGDIKGIERLLQQGANINARDDRHKSTPLVIAAHQGNASVARLLLDKGADVNLQDDKGLARTSHSCKQREHGKGQFVA